MSTEDIIPPINRLPPESLGEIFSLAQNRGVELARRTPDSPWKLAFVCRRWRDIIFTTAQLWANIQVPLVLARAHGIKIRRDVMIAAWTKCLDRSRGCPLVLSIQAYTDDAVEFIPSLMPICISHADHWENVTLDVPIDLLVPFVSDPNLRYPRLRSLKLRGNVVFQEHLILPQIIELFKEAPLLSKLCLDDFPYHLAQLRLPWSQITELNTHVSAGGVNGFLDALRLMPNLLSLQFSQSSEIVENVQMIKDLELPQLRKLIWSTFNVDHSLFFNSVRAPRLTEIEFKCEDGSWDKSVEHFIRRSGCTVKSLRLVMVSAYLATSLLSILPGVEAVTFYVSHLDKDLIRSLTFDESRSQWPGQRIRKLVLENVLFPESLQDEFISMLQSRLQVPEALEDRCRMLESLRIIRWKYTGGQVRQYADLFATFELLKERLSPQHITLITYEGK